MQTLTTPDSISGPFASGANALKNAIPNSSTGTYLASMEDGFPASTMQPVALGGTPPDGKDLNGILNKVSQHYFQFQNGYLPTFVQETSELIGGYPEGAVLWYTPAGETKAIPVISLIGNNTYNFNTTPSYIDGTHWDYAITGNYVTTYTNQTIGGDKDFTGTLTAPTPAAGDDSTKIATTAFVINVLEAMYPVGSVYIGTQNTCPMSAFFGTWTLVSSGKALWTGDGTNGDTTIAAGLPNITGSWKNLGKSASAGSGAVKCTTQSWGNRDAENGQNSGSYTFDASRSSSVYGNSDTVQPPAYVVNVWRRTA